MSTFLIKTIVGLSILGAILICVDTFVVTLWSSCLAQNRHTDSSNKEEPMLDKKSNLLIVDELEQGKRKKINSRLLPKAASTTTTLSKVGGGRNSVIPNESSLCSSTIVSHKSENSIFSNSICQPEIRFMHTTKEAAEKEILKIQQNPKEYLGDDDEEEDSSPMKRSKELKTYYMNGLWYIY